MPKPQHNNDTAVYASSNNMQLSSPGMRLKLEECHVQKKYLCLLQGRLKEVIVMKICSCCLFLFLRRLLDKSSPQHEPGAVTKTNWRHTAIQLVLNLQSVPANRNSVSSHCIRLTSMTGNLKHLDTVSCYKHLNNWTPR